MTTDLLAALCLVLVLEGLFLFIGPETWKRMAAEMQAVPARALRAAGGMMVIAGLLALQWVRS
ncbi:MAG: DUF2065 family protein [Xanthomonadales bacterium]|nr:DUF2065 family protein [Xanthomonadales bacterium]